MLLNWLLKKDKQEAGSSQSSETANTNNESLDKETVMTNANDNDKTNSSDSRNASFNHEQVLPQSNGTPQNTEESIKIRRDQIEFIAPDSKHRVQQLAMLNVICLPIRYGTDERSPHYRNVLKNALAVKGPQNDDDEHSPNFWTKLAYYLPSRSLVGAITVSTCRIRVDEQQTPKFAVHVLTLAVLPTFRRRGVASLLLQELQQQCEQWPNIEKIFLRCQASNEAARALYRLHGFAEVAFLPKYYKRWDIADADAYMLEMDIAQRNGSI